MNESLDSWNLIKKVFLDKSLFSQYKHHEEMRFLKITNTTLHTGIKYSYDMLAVEKFLSFLEVVFKSDSFKILIEISDRRRVIGTFRSITKFKEYLKENYTKKLPHPESESLFRYANFGIAIENNDKELYLIHDGYISKNEDPQILSYHYFWNTEKSINKLRAISKGIKQIDEDSAYKFYNDVMNVDDYRLRTLLLHLSIEYYINKIIEKCFPIEKIMGLPLSSFKRKLDQLRKEKIINNHLHQTCEEINRIRNEIAHDLFHYPYDFIKLERIMLKRYKVDFNQDELSIYNIVPIITAISMEILDELAEILISSRKVF